MKFFRYTMPGEMIPRSQGACWYDYSRMCLVTCPIGINWIVRVAFLFYQWVQFPFRDNSIEHNRKELERREKNGYIECVTLSRDGNVMARNRFYRLEQP